MRQTDSPPTPHVLTREDVVSRLRALKKNLFQKYRISAMALFGSVARGDAGPESDVDILVELDPRIGWEFFELGDRLESELGCTVHLATREGMKISLWKRIEPELFYV